MALVVFRPKGKALWHLRPEAVLAHCDELADRPGAEEIACDQDRIAAGTGAPILGLSFYGSRKGGAAVSWSKPKAREVKCGMEINMFGPAEDDRDNREVI